MQIMQRSMSTKMLTSEARRGRAPREIMTYVQRGLSLGPSCLVFCERDSEFHWRHRGHHFLGLGVDSRNLGPGSLLGLMFPCCSRRLFSLINWFPQFLKISIPFSTHALIAEPLFIKNKGFLWKKSINKKSAIFLSLL